MTFYFQIFLFSSRFYRSNMTCFNYLNIFSPSCWDIEMLVKMIDAGMNVARLNFSHGDHKSHGGCVTRLREALKQRPDKTCGIMLDTKGPEIRTGMLRDNKPVEITAGQQLKIVTDYAIEGDNKQIVCSYKSLPQTVHVGSTIFIADGSLTCEVTEVHEVSIVKHIDFCRNFFAGIFKLNF